MPYDDTKVFDVAKPSLAHPDATGRPVIVGNQPEMNDPMVKETQPSTPIHVAMADEEESSPLSEDIVTKDSQEEEAEKAVPETADDTSAESHHQEVTSSSSIDENEKEPTPLSEASNSEAQAPELVTEEPQSESSENHPEQGQTFAPASSLISTDNEQPEPKEQNSDSADHQPPPPDIPPLSMPRGAGPHRRWPKTLTWLVLILVIFVVAAYLAIDDGLVQANIKLPFHIFNKQKTSSSNLPPPPVSSAPPAVLTTPAVPTSFTSYKIAGTGLNFAYPATWGSPTVTTDPGFSSRSKTAKSDGTHAYLVDFATNKGVELAFTSPKYLPATRSPLYYDYLQWCVGTNDAKFYKQTLLFSTSNGTDTPTTVVCNQGPLTAASKIDNQTIFEPKTPETSSGNAAQSVLIDLYTENLNNSDWPVLRVKDTTMTNGTEIKTLLTTVRVTAVPSGNPTPASSTP